MPIPSRAEQARKLAEWLEAGAEEEETVEKFAGRLVDAFHEMLKWGLKGPTLNLEVGDAFKSPLSSKVYWIAYRSSDQYWLTQADSSYGWLVNRRDDFFNLATRSSASAGRPGTNEAWAVGDVVSTFQGSLKYQVVAVHAKGVLLEDYYGTSLMAQSNEDMNAYTKEGE